MATDCDLSRRSILLGGAALVSGQMLPSAPATAHPEARKQPTHRSLQPMITCFIRYRIDPFQREAFKHYAENWGRIIPRCSGHLVGYFLPHEGTNDVAWGLIAFENLAAYETYRARLRADAEGRANFAMAQSQRFILSEERTFTEIVPGTFFIPPQSAGS